MKTGPVLLSLVLLQSGSNALPLWLSGVTEKMDITPRKSEWLPSPQQIAENAFKSGRLNEYAESTLRSLFDEHDIVPEEHEWGGQDRPFNLEEYFSYSLPEKPKAKGWKKVWQGIRDIFSPSSGSEIKGPGAAAKTTFGTDGSVRGDLESVVGVIENGIDSWRSIGVGSRGSRQTAQERIDSGMGAASGTGKRVPVDLKGKKPAYLLPGAKESKYAVKPGSKDKYTMHGAKGY